MLQNVLAISTVVLIVGWSIWSAVRRHRKSNEKDCGCGCGCSCSSNIKPKKVKSFKGSKNL
ncbi:MAG TPA: FeoB-associated Cys-rich membrane protein [Candidatus Avirikenella pullistercoris]|nr:FeoB-associated Cys-rich membrane protein [Candidatus Avirikenella pullistercoris]